MYKTKRQRKEARWDKSSNHKYVRVFVKGGEMAILFPKLDPRNAVGFTSNFIYQTYGMDYKSISKAFHSYLGGHEFSTCHQPLHRDIGFGWTEIK